LNFIFISASKEDSSLQIYKNIFSKNIFIGHHLKKISAKKLFLQSGGGKNDCYK
jgi:hypothetical protein